MSPNTIQGMQRTQIDRVHGYLENLSKLMHEQRQSNPISIREHLSIREHFSLNLWEIGAPYDVMVMQL